MPATQVSPALRRRISDDARELLRSAFESPDLDLARRARDTATFRFNELPLEARLQNFRGRLRLELLADGEGSADAVVSSFDLRLVVSSTTFLVRYHVEDLDAEVSVANNSGVVTSWITSANGSHTQLQDFLHDARAGSGACKHLIRSLLEMLELLDLPDLFSACSTAVEVPEQQLSGGATSQRVYYASSDKNSYVFTFHSQTGCPVSVTLAPMAQSSATTTVKLRLAIGDYLRHFDGIAVPSGIKSDVDIMIDTAMTCYAHWSVDGQQHLQRIFSSLDLDDDGWVSGCDVYRQLLAVGHSEARARRVVLELGRLLCDSDDPSEEFAFYRFAGFWITMLADGHRVSDPRNESTVLAALDQLFLGV